jgi:siroheme synthase (precorrin-2 oxidase/ferrochelatase)
MKPRITRRRLVAGAAGFGAGVLLLPGTSARAYAANEKLNLALVGCGNRGGNLLESFLHIGEKVVALCDVNRQRAAKTFQKAPDVPKHVDYRKMLEEHGRHIDAVLVATTDHHHAPCSALAMKLGKPVYCEKPLTLSVQEARDIRRIAKQAGVATQMGNQGAATDAFREQVELLQTGGLGEVRDGYVWCRLSNVGVRPLPTDSERAPETLAWDLYLGPRAARPYSRAWVSWGTWRDFGTGQLGNWGAHAAAALFRGLKLDTLWDARPGAGAPPRIRVRPRSAETNAHCFPTWEIIDFEFPARGNMPPVTLHWFKGDDAPGFLDKIQQLTGREAASSACLVVGAKGKYLASGHNSAYSLLSGGGSVTRPEPFLPRHGSHEREWLDAIRGKVKEPFSNFDVASREIETLMLGNVATMLGRPIEYDPLSGTCPGDDQATTALDREHREGWKL